MGCAWVVRVLFMLVWLCAGCEWVVFGLFVACVRQHFFQQMVLKYAYFNLLLNIIIIRSRRLKTHGREDCLDPSISCLVPAHPCLCRFLPACPPARLSAKKTDRQTNKQIDRRKDGRTDRQTDRQTERQTDRQINRATDKQKNRQTNRKKKQTDRHKQAQTDTETDI